MKSSKQEIGQALKKELSKGYNVERISNWAYDVFISLRDESTPELDAILERLSIMGAGPEFEYKQEELEALSEKLIKEKANPS